MATAYLDNNIFVSIEQNEYSLEQVIKNIDFNINAIPYSAAHIQEADNYEDKTNQNRNQFINNRLNTIKKITNCLYLYQQLPSNEVYFLREDPQEVLNTIREVPFAKSAMNIFMNLISSEQKRQFRSALGIDVKRLNNYSPIEVVEHLNIKLKDIGYNKNIIELLEESISYNPQGNTFGISNRIAGIMELLDMIGYWKDKETQTSNYARLWDANHVFFASHCNYFISDDKNARYKARVIYDIYNIGTKIVSSKGKE